jgi:hypothetical protein
MKIYAVYWPEGGVASPYSVLIYWPENVIDLLGKWRPTCVMRHARGQKLQSFRRKWPFRMGLSSVVYYLLLLRYVMLYALKSTSERDTLKLGQRTACAFFVDIYIFNGLWENV